MSKKENIEEPKYTKKAILLDCIGVKRDVLKTLLDDSAEYSLSEVDSIYKKFLEGGN